MIYGAVNRDVLARVPGGASRVLDVGCGTGALGRVVKIQRGRARGVRVVGEVVDALGRQTVLQILRVHVRRVRQHRRVTAEQFEPARL